MPSRLDRGGSLGGLRRGASYGQMPGSGENGALIFSASVTNGAPFTVPDPGPATVLTIPAPIVFATQHVYAHFDCELDSEAVAGGNNVIFTMRIDGVVSDTREQSVLTGSNELPVSMHSLYVALAPGAHTVDVQAAASAAASYIIGTGRARLTIIVLPG